MARINSYTKITGAPADSDCFIIDSTQGTAGTRIMLWSVLKSVLTGAFASKSHKHPGSDITSAVANANAATNDSTGQNIASTYVKEITANGRTITVKRGNDTTFTFQMQDTNTNTTYPVADASKSGIMAASDWSLLHSLKAINKAVDISHDTDLNSYNSVDKCGWYYAAGGSTAVNKPSGVNYFGMFVMQTALGVITQILYDNNKKIWTRSWVHSSWSSWTALVRTTDTIASATNATKATQDSAGQTINTTYVKSVTASGRTVTVTKGNGTTSTFTTQDTTYPLATQSANGLMSSADKRKLDGLSGDHASAIGLATSSKDGLMPKTDKAKLDAIGSISTSTIDGFFRI